MHGATASVELREPQAPDSILRIRGIPADAIVITMDSFPAPDALFNCDKGECKRADYVIVAILPNKRRILYLELKRTKASRGDVVKQLLGAECILLYCKQVAEAFFDEGSLLAGYQSRFVSCGHTSICPAPCDYIPRRSYPLFLAREVLRLLRAEARTTSKRATRRPASDESEPA